MNPKASIDRSLGRHQFNLSIRGLNIHQITHEDEFQPKQEFYITRVSG